MYTNTAGVHTCQAAIEAAGQTPVSLQVQLFLASLHVCPPGHPRSMGRLGAGLGAGACFGESRWQELLPSGRDCSARVREEMPLSGEITAEKGSLV